VLITVVVLSLVVTAIPLRYHAVMAGDPHLREPEYRNLIGAGMSAWLAAFLDVTSATLLFAASFVGGVLVFLRGWGALEAVLKKLLAGRSQVATGSG
jgi:hypothetical protein